MSNLKEAALAYHEFPVPGKLATRLTKPTETQQDLALAYSPGVAEPVRCIAEHPDDAFRYTQKANLVGVISNGTAVLGLGHVGPLASKPVMEGKAVLFKKLANVDCFDIEVDETDIDKFVDIVAALEPTFGGINLEDIKGPDCFIIEKKLSELLSIPVFHDDQHGTAITTCAALLNAAHLQGKELKSLKIVCVGAGAAGIACMDLATSLGVDKKNIFLHDSKGLVTHSRSSNTYKAQFAQPDRDDTSLLASLKDADVFVGLSVANLLTKEMLLSMAENPIIFAMANPDPEIMPHVALNIRQDIIMATGRSDFANQVNNVLCFPYIFRGALDVRASQINLPMKLAAVHAISSLARSPVPPGVLTAYNLDEISFGPQYILPKPTDKRLYAHVSGAVARAAVETNVARAPLPVAYIHDEKDD